MVASSGVPQLAEALRHVGVRESPPGSNRTPFGRWFGADGVPWCAIFASYCFDVGGGSILRNARLQVRICWIFWNGGRHE